ncbi:kinesin-like protein 3A [Lycorma delicatula]|uniref:kinesin-like protein 3A n=1 Tax=Lycorma delicatula TaxID=130591 RepID=UPI003F51693E
MAAHDTVQVAVRVRPLNESEIEKGSRLCLDVYKKESQIVFKGHNQGFTFNYVFSHEAQQEEIYDAAVKELLKQLFKGYNVTILAYGQTGSGKTFTMGTNYSPDGKYPKGIIPLAVEDIFKKINSDDEWEFTATASFIELYQEQLYDLLSDRPRDCSVVDIREDTRGICIPNLTERIITCTKETFDYLQQGSLCRATGATAMNPQSSRSHAIFTISLNFNKKDNVDDAMTAKFHLVDLAGSERPKKTKTTGERFKEGVNINKGLLALGNVISALGDGNHSYISYRDSKLTRLLQDSLGGNSQTLMIACVSPSDFNQDETLSTLRYADRARRIKNRPIINQDPKVAENAKLRKEIEQLKLELLALRSQTDNRLICSSVNMLPESGDCALPVCPPEHQSLLGENNQLKEKVKKLVDALSDSLQQNYNLSERALIAEKARDRINQKMAELDVEYSHTLESFNQSRDISALEPLHELQMKIRELQAEQKRSEEEILNHEMHAANLTVAECKSDGDTAKCPGTPKDFIQLRETHVFEQAELSKELQVLTKNLAYKEELVKKLAASSGFMADTRTDSEGHMKDFQEQISSLQHERDELAEQLRTMQQNSVGNKLAEQRRKRLQELEQRIGLLNKKVTEQARVIKMKEKSDEKIVNLNKEILSMKQTKVRLIQQMKVESERYRTLKLTRERELCRLREQDRKRQNQMLKMEMLHNKQQNVLKRKVEEAAAVNKRLKDALAVKNAAQDRLGSLNKPERITSWVDQELEILVSTAEAERTLDQLLKDRSSLNQELTKLKNTLSESYISVEDKSKIKNEIELLSQDIELRSTQIADMQQKIMDSNQESKLRSHVDTLNSLMDARNVIKYLFNLATDAKKEVSHKQYILQDIKDSYTEAEEKLRNSEKQISEIKDAHERELMRLEKDNQDKVYLLLSQLHSKDHNIHSNDANNNLLERIKIQNEELEKMDSLRQEVGYLRSTVDKLNKELEAKQNQQQKEKKKKEKNSENTNNGLSTPVHLINEFDDNENDVDDDDEKDPDWRNTPMFKRLQALKQERNTTAVKRGSDGLPKCCCKSDCAKKTCSCRKAGATCGTRCKCSIESCKNTEDNKLSNDGSFDENETSSNNGSFKKPRPLSPLINFGNTMRTIMYD